MEEAFAPNVEFSTFCMNTPFLKKMIKKRRRLHMPGLKTWILEEAFARNVESIESQLELT